MNHESNDAEFIGWQEVMTGGRYPLYNVTVEHHPSFGATVSDEGLLKLNLKIPRTPPRPDRLG